MRMHPMRAGPRREIIDMAFAILDRPLITGLDNAVLIRRRRLPVPMDDRCLAASVDELEEEALIGVENEARGTIRRRDAEDGSRFAVDLDRAALDDELRQRARVERRLDRRWPRIGELAKAEARREKARGAERRRGGERTASRKKARHQPVSPKAPDAVAGSLTWQPRAGPRGSTCEGVVE